MKSFAAILLIGVILRIDTIDAKLPPSIHVCKRNDPDLNKCIVESVNALRPLLATGKISDDFSIPPLEPLALSTVNMDRGSEFKATFSELLVSGPSKFQVDNLKEIPIRSGVTGKVTESELDLNDAVVNIDKLTFDFNIYLPKLSFRGKYDLKIRLLLLNIAGVGDLKGVLENSRARVKLYCERYDRDGQQYMRVKRLAVKIQIEKGQFDMKDLFNGDPVLSQVGNQFINDNSRLFLDELTPGLERSLSETFKNTANEILQLATLDDMFPAA